VGAQEREQHADNKIKGTDMQHPQAADSVSPVLRVADVLHREKSKKNKNTRVESQSYCAMHTTLCTTLCYKMTKMNGLILLYYLKRRVTNPVDFFAS